MTSRARESRELLRTRVLGLDFQNPILLAAGTAGYGRELADVVDLDSLGGIVTKAVSVEPRAGNPSLRVGEFRGGMVNAVGLANPGVERARTNELPWLVARFPHTRKIVNVVGRQVTDFADVIGFIEETDGAQPDAYELNVSCPNVKAGGLEFGADPAALTAVIGNARTRTTRPLFVKLSPSHPDIANAARTAVSAGANAITLVNTLPGLVIDIERRKPRLSFGSGGVSGSALLPVGVLATWRVHQAVDVPIVGVGGVSSADDALQYFIAGASLVGVGTAALRDPRVPQRIVRDLARWCRRHDVTSLSQIIGTLEWPTP